MGSERESTPSLISSVSPSLTGRLSVTLGPFQPSRKGDNWPVEAGRWAASVPNLTLRHSSINPPAPCQGGQVEEKQESEQRTERDKHSGGMEIEPTMKWRLRNMELRQGGSGGGRGGNREFIFGNGEVAHSKKTYCHTGWSKNTSATSCDKYNHIHLQNK